MEALETRIRTTLATAIELVQKLSLGQSQKEVKDQTIKSTVTCLRTLAQAVDKPKGIPRAINMHFKPQLQLLASRANALQRCCALLATKTESLEMETVTNCFKEMSKCSGELEGLKMPPDIWILYQLTLSSEWLKKGLRFSLRNTHSSKTCLFNRCCVLSHMTSLSISSDNVKFN